MKYLPSDEIVRAEYFGYYKGLPCWNHLSEAQQERLIYWGNLPLFSEPEGDKCVRPAEVGIETMYDQSPGLRFYCIPCAVEHLENVKQITISPDFSLGENQELKNG